MRGVAKWVGRAEAPSDAPRVLDEAFRQMLGKRYQPVVFEMAPDIMGKVEDVTLQDAQTYRHETVHDEDALAEAARLLGTAAKPAIFVGSGVFEAEAELLRVTELLEAPVIMDRTGRAVPSATHIAPGAADDSGQELWDGRHGPGRRYTVLSPGPRLGARGRGQVGAHRYRSGTSADATPGGRDGHRASLDGACRSG